MYTIQKGDKKMDTNFEVNMNEYLRFAMLYLIHCVRRFCVEN